jgi:uncharacterized protein (TIGR04255 family)
MEKRYKNPPIIEAVCEFRFRPGKAWNSSFPAQIHDLLRQTFPQKREMKAFQASLTIAPQGSQQQLHQNDVLQILREDEKALVIIDIDRLAVSHLSPYPTWEEFLPLIKQGFSAYKSVAAPNGLHRIGLRYINHIEMPGTQINLYDYMNVFPTLNWQLTEGYGAFILGLQIPFAEQRDLLNLQLSSATANSADSIAVVLDLDYFLGQPEATSFETVFDWLEEAHQRVEDAFESCIRDPLRTIFEEDKE